MQTYKMGEENYLQKYFNSHPVKLLMDIFGNISVFHMEDTINNKHRPKVEIEVNGKRFRYSAPCFTDKPLYMSSSWFEEAERSCALLALAELCDIYLGRSGGFVHHPKDKFAMDILSSPSNSNNSNLNLNDGFVYNYNDNMQTPESKFKRRRDVSPNSDDEPSYQRRKI